MRKRRFSECLSRSSPVCMYVSAHIPLRQTLRLPPTTMQYRLRVALEVAEAMAYASSRFHNRFIHRDIKSSNVFLDDAGHAKLADFGIARLIPFPKKSQSSEETMGGRGGQGRGRAAKAAAAAAAGAAANTLFSERDDYQVCCLLIRLID